MNNRVEVNDDHLAVAMGTFNANLNARLQVHGHNGYIGPHEIWGSVDEEYQEFKDAVHANDTPATIAELADVMVACAWGIASLVANADEAAVPVQTPVGLLKAEDVVKPEIHYYSPSVGGAMCGVPGKFTIELVAGIDNRFLVTCNDCKKWMRGENIAGS